MEKKSLTRILEWEGEKVKFNGQEGTLILIPKDEYSRKELGKENWGIHIEIDKKNIPIPHLGYGISPSRFNGFYTINANGEIIKK